MAQHHQQGRQCPCKLLPQCLSSFTAAEYGDLHSLSSRPDVAHKVGPGGYTPLHYAVQNGHAAATALLLGLGADVDGRPKVQDKSLSVLQRGDCGERSEKSWCGATPLHRASFSGAISAMQVLLQWNAPGGGSAAGICSGRQASCDLLAQDSSFGDLMTPLHKAAAGGRPLAVQLLLEALRTRQCQADNSADESNQGSDNMVRQGLTALDSQGRTPLEVAKDIDPVEGKKSVKRWDNIAGGPADWTRCIAILEHAEQEAGLHQSQSSQRGVQKATLPTLPKHLLDTASCLDCGAEDGTCRTFSWEAAFRQMLSSSANQAVGTYRESNEVERDEMKTSASIDGDTPPPRNVNEPTTPDVEGDIEPFHNVGANPLASVGKDDTRSSNVRMGQTCSACGECALALFRGHEGALVCKNCRGQSWRRNVITVVKM